MKRTLLFIVYVLLSLSGYAQTANNWIRQMAMDGDNLWLATNAGLVKYNKLTGEHTTYTRFNNGLCSDDLISVTCRNGKVLVGSYDNGVSEFDGRVFRNYNRYNTPFFTNQSFEEVLYDSDGNLWLGGLYYIYKYDGIAWEKYTQPQALFSSWVAYSALKQSADGTIWFCSNGPNFDGSLGCITKEKEVKTVVTRCCDAYNMDIDKQGNVWFNDIYNGILCYDGNSTKLFNSKNSPLPEYGKLKTLGLAVDVDNNVWFGCNNLLYKYDGSEFTSYQLPTDARVSDLLIDGKAIWVATRGDGLFRFEDGQFERIEYTSNTQPTEEDDYRPLVEEGKHWTYDNFMSLRPAEYDHYYYYDLKGDTLIAGQQCLKMYSDNKNNDNVIRYEGALYEENKKVYCFFPNKEAAVLLYDFDCAVGDVIQVSVGQLFVKDIQTEDNGGITIKRYTLQTTSNEEVFSWIEGVGASKDFFYMLPLDGNYNSLSACELNGEMLYQKIEQDLTEEGYHRMAIEGKCWNYIHYYADEDGEHYEPYSYVVRGDTIIRRITYKKLYYQDEKTERLECLLLERGRTVYKSIDLGNNSYDEPILTSFFEFDRNDFGRVFTWKAKNVSGNTNWMVYGVDTLEVNNCQFRRYTCLQKYSEDDETLTTIEYGGEGVWNDIWVEGVGSASSGIEDQYPPHEPPMRTPGEYTAFVSCYEDGECIFTAEDFTKLGSGDTTPQMAYYYYKGTKIPLTLNESKVCVNIPKECKGTSERVQANAKVLTTINDDTFDIFVISRSDFEKLTSLDSWKEDSKSVILTSVYFTERNEKVYSTPHLYVKLKKEQDIDLLKSYAEKYKLRIVKNVPLMPLWYILSITLESEKSPLECANELWETGYFAAAEPSFAADDYGIEEPYRPFVEEGKVWKLGGKGSVNPVQLVEYYYFDGDTIIDGKRCKQMMCQRFVNPNHPDFDIFSQYPLLRYVGAWYEEDKKVYVYNTLNKQFQMKYDFSLDANETLQLIDGYPPYMIGPKQTGGLEGFKGVYRDVMWRGEGEPYYNTTWLEGVGSIEGPIMNVYLGEEYYAMFLMSCTVGDEVIYLNDEYEDGATPESMEAKKNRFDFTHTIKTKPHAPRRNGSGDAEESEMQPLYGEYNDHQLGIHLNSLDDTYQVSITNESGQVVYEKTINAGNIVALSIDISAYAKGRYTVTLENSRESFTGEFEALTTGIEAITNNKEVIRHNIYNLQGQRLSSLQKGLNIVNGQKIFVK